jgi:S-adenosylmethionine:tRNA ribosyltransferase-isomerase
VVAVGTTTARALETSASGTGRVRSFAGLAELTVTPGYRFRVVDALLTNFHLPRSSLLVLVSAFAGREATLAAYRHAVSAGYRFYSYGDAMLIV